MNRITEWLVFNDKEIGTFQYLFQNYMIENEKKLTKFQCYQLAILASETQYQIRILKERILKFIKKDTQNDNYIKLINSFPNLIDFIANSFVQKFDKMDKSKKFLYMKENETSYFNLSDQMALKLRRDICNIY